MRNLSIDNGLISILGIILLAILVIFVLNYFNIHIRVWVGNGQAQGGGEAKSLWNEYLKKPLETLWNFIKEVFWRPFVSNLERLRAGQSTDFNNSFDNSLPTVPY